MKSYVKYILSKFAIIVLMPEIIFVSDSTGAEMPQKPYYEKGKFTFSVKSLLNLKLRHRKAPRMILSEIYGDPYGRPGDWYRICETPG